MSEPIRSVPEDCRPRSAEPPLPPELLELLLELPQAAMPTVASAMAKAAIRAESRVFLIKVTPSWFMRLRVRPRQLSPATARYLAANLSAPASLHFLKQPPKL